MHARTGRTASDEVFDGLRARGFKLTGARRAIVEALCEGGQPFTVAELGARLAERRVRADKTTVYREIRFLRERGLIEQVQFGDRVKRYEFRGDAHHHHLVCVECGNVVDVPLENDLSREERTIARRTGFSVIRHALEFFGVCPSCR